MLTNMKTMADRIRERRLELNREMRDGHEWPQDIVAQKCKVKQQTYAAVESGKTKKPGFMVQLAKALQTTPEWLMDGIEPKEHREALGGVPPAQATYSGGKSPVREAAALHDHILGLCEALSEDAKSRIDVDRLARDMREILGHVPEQPRKPQKKMA